MVRRCRKIARSAKIYRVESTATTGICSCWRDGKITPTSFNCCRPYCKSTTPSLPTEKYSKRFICFHFITPELCTKTFDRSLWKVGIQYLQKCFKMFKTVETLFVEIHLYRCYCNWTQCTGLQSVSESRSRSWGSCAIVIAPEYEMNEWKCSDLKCIQKQGVGLV